MSTFSGLGTALSALNSQRRGLETAAHNIANAGTDGYSRQRVELSAVGPTPPARHATPSAGAGGVTVASVTRVRDAYLEARVRTEHERLAAATTGVDVLDQVQTVFDEPGTTGLQAKLADLWAGFADVADNPADPAARTQLLSRARAVAGALNTGAAELAGQYADRRAALDTAVTEANTQAGRLAALNGAITRATAAGGTADELADQRDTLVLSLVESTGAQVTRAADGSVGLALGGAALVSGTTVRALAAGGSASLAGRAADPVALRWADGTAAGPAGGALGATLDGLNAVLPGYAADWDTVASTLADRVNTLHTAGYTTTGVPGGAFFGGSTAAGIAVANTDPAAVAASSAATQALGAGTADALAGLADSPTGPDAVYRTAVSRIAAQTAAAQGTATTQETLTRGVDAARAADSGVNIDEELTAVLGYQRSYEAAAKVMSAVDAMLDTLINRTGA